MIIDRERIASALAGITTRASDIDTLHAEYNDRWSEAESRFDHIIRYAEPKRCAPLRKLKEQARVVFLTMHEEVLDRAAKIKTAHTRIEDETATDRQRRLRLSQELRVLEDGLASRWKQQFEVFKALMTGTPVGPDIEPVSARDYYEFRRLTNELRRAADQRGTPCTLELRKLLTLRAKRMATRGQISTLNQCLAYLLANNTAHGQPMFRSTDPIWNTHTTAAKLASRAAATSTGVALDLPLGFKVILATGDDSLWLFHFVPMTRAELQLLQKHGWKYMKDQSAWTAELTPGNLTLLEHFASNWKRAEKAFRSHREPRDTKNVVPMSAS